MKRMYFVDNKGCVFWIDGQWAVYGGFRTAWVRRMRRQATDDEITVFENKERERDRQREEREQRESYLLSLCGLSRDDFVRFRGVERVGDNLIVHTRENGVGMRSVDAIRNENYVESHPDVGDSTYEWYEFKIPEVNS